ncbi:PrsW family intramembrane metalloprotease [Leucobacter sp. PH1c]|uniref:PrsW family intramembrane metalloprotease n=1 Tax=Leucobacter sp. PH1c TaxID=1397278 RepID=UPI0009E01E13|nr:PrsW family intramembrane metalloprotease [Leucobacter sp. PH1c]
MNRDLSAGAVPFDGADLPVSRTPGEQRRAAALRVSGWGAPFRFVQPRNLAFWVYLALTGVGVFNIWQYFGPRVEFYAESFAIGAVLCVLCGAAWAWWFHRIDRWERQPAGLIITALVWGAVPATFAFALTVNGAMLSLYAKLFGQEWSSHWAAGFTAPFTEEAAKLCGFVLIMALAPRLVRTANDGLIIGAFIGLGFAVFEDFLYSANATVAGFSVSPDVGAMNVAVTRIAVSAVSHPLFSALVCSGLVFLLGTVAQPRRVGRGIALILAGMFLHFTWDNANGLGAGNGLLTLGVMAGSIVLAMIVLSRAFALAAPVEYGILEDLLAPEVESGFLSEEEVSAVLGRRNRRAFLAQAPTHRARRARKHWRSAILDLAHAIAREGDDTAHARSEVSRLRSRASA